MKLRGLSYRANCPDFIRFMRLMRRECIRCCWLSERNAIRLFKKNAGRRRFLTIANHILGFGQMSLAKYLFIIAKEDNPKLDIHDIAGYFIHLLERIDWTRDLHFQTNTTIDTLDYSGTGI